MVRTQLLLDDPRCAVVDELARELSTDRSVIIREVVDELVRISSMTAAQALLAWADEFASPDTATIADGHDAQLEAGGM